MTLLAQDVVQSRVARLASARPETGVFRNEFVQEVGMMSDLTTVMLGRFHWVRKVIVALDCTNCIMHIDASTLAVKADRDVVARRFQAS